MSRKAKHPAAAVPAADYAILNIPDAVPIPYDTPASPLYGVGVAALNDGLKVYVDPYVGMRLGDRVEVYWDESDTPFAFVDVDDSNLNDVLSLKLDASLFLNGDFQPRYAIVRESSTVAVSPSRDIRVILSLPGGPDPDPSTPHNENLAAPIVPDDILQNGVDASQAAQGVPVTIEPYLNMGEYDRVDFSWGGQRRTRYVMPGEPGSAITLTIEEAQILAAGDGRIQLMYQVFDAAANRSAGWSLVTVLDVVVQGAILDAPTVDQATDGILQLADLNGTDVQVRVATTSEHFSTGNTVELTWAGTTEAGQPRNFSATKSVAAVPGEVIFQVPYADVEAIVQGNAVVSYVLHKGAGNDLPSKRTQVQVLDNIQKLPAPSVLEASGGSLAADTEPATVEIAAYEGMAAGDLVTLFWEGLTTEGSPLSYSDSHVISGAGVGRTVTFSVDGNQISPLGGGSLTVYYQVTNDSGIRESEHLELSVSAAVQPLPAPQVKEALDGFLSPDVLQATVLITAYQDMATQDRVDLLWRGNVSGDYTDWLPVTSATVGHDLDFTVYAESITPNSSAEVSYSVTPEGGSPRPSAVLYLGIGEPLQLPAPTIDQAEGDLLDPANVPNGATVRIAASANLEAGDVLTVHWVGTPGAGSIDIPHNVSGGQAGKEVTVVVPLSVVEANEGNSIELSYDLARASGAEETSPASTYRILTAALPLPPPSIDEAVGNELNPDDVPAGATVNIPASADLREGDHVTVRWQGLPGPGSVEIGHGVTADEAGQDLKINIPATYVLANDGYIVILDYLVKRVDGSEQTSPAVEYDITRNLGDGSLLVMGARSASEYIGHPQRKRRILTALNADTRLPLEASWQYEGDSESVLATSFRDTQPDRLLRVSTASDRLILNPANLSGSGDATGGLFSYGAMAARLDSGHVVAWGASDSGGHISSTIATMDDILDLTAGRQTFAARRRDDAVIAWGKEDTGGDVPGTITGLDVVAVSATAGAFAARCKEGNLVAWGSRSYGGRVPDDIASYFDIIDVAGSEGAFAALHGANGQGRVLAWGSGGDGGSLPSDIASFDDIVEIVASNHAFAALRANGSVLAWGASGSGGNLPSEIAVMDNVVELVATRRAFAARLASGHVVAWGDSNYGGRVSDAVAGLTDAVEISATAWAFTVRRATGHALSWGNSSYGGKAPTAVLELDDVVQVVGTEGAFAALRRNGQVATWGQSHWGGDSGDVQGQLTEVRAIYAGAMAFAALCADKRVVTWGDRSKGGNSSSVSGVLNGGISYEATPTSRVIGKPARPQPQRGRRNR